MRARRAGFAVATLVVAAAASCSLGLDESLLGQQADADVDGALVDSPGADGGDGAPIPPSPEGGICAKDEDCTTTHGCLTAKCDLLRSACVFPVCRTAVCQSASCDTTAQACGDPGAYPYRASQFAVGAPVGCGGVLARCFVAVHPFVFVGTANGVVAFDVSDPQRAEPPQIPVIGLGFSPTQMVASGSRVYFLGAPFGAAPTSRLPLAYLEVPATPFVDQLVARSVLPTWSRPSNEGVVLYPRERDTSLVVGVNPAAAYPSAFVEPPVDEPFTITATAMPFPANMGPVAGSGARLVMGRINPANGVASFSFVNAAGSESPLATAEKAVESATPASAPQVFAQGSNGALFWSVAHLSGPPGLDPPSTIRAVRGYFLVADGEAEVDIETGLDIELYPPGEVGAGGPVVGPAAFVDPNTVLVTTAAPANLAQTHVQFVTRAPLGIVTNGADDPRRDVIPLPPTQLAAAGSNGLGYLLAVNPEAPAAPTVFTYDPACAP
jgi:hypothetical protein